MNEKWEIWVDTGGTFTDCIGINPNGTLRKTKVLSSSSLRGSVIKIISAKKVCVFQEWDAPSGFINGFKFRLLSGDFEARVIQFDASESVIELDSSIPSGLQPHLSFEVISSEEAPVLAARLITSTPAGKDLPSLNLRLATTRGTNALLERKGAKTVLFITKGFGDLPEIGTQQRPDLFALQIIKPTQIYQKVIEVHERLDKNGTILIPFDAKKMEHEIQSLIHDGYQSAAVVFMHSYANPIHEEQLKKVLLKCGFEYVSTSASLAPFIRILPRLQTTLVNASLAPIIDAYLNKVSSGIGSGSLFIMNSTGGLSIREKYSPKDCLLSGPAGGVVGAAAVASQEGFNRAITFDMGGTSTDVARFDGDFEFVFEHKVGDAHLVAPALSIETVAAGGGSLCYFDGYKLCVGPESAGAFPGPACYGAGGPLTITDVNLLLGRLDEQNFHIPVQMEDAQKKLDEILTQIETKNGKRPIESEILNGFLRIANERMADAIQKVSVKKGYNPADYALVAFGGAGGQHACAIAGLLDIKTIIISEHAGLLSAFGLGHALMEAITEKQVLQPLDVVSQKLDSWWRDLEKQAFERFVEISGSEKHDGRVRRKILSLRFEGQHHSLDLDVLHEQNAVASFKQQYMKRYGHWITGKKIEVVNMRVIVSDSGNALHLKNNLIVSDKNTPVQFKETIWNGKKQRIPIYEISNLSNQLPVEGPAVILDPHSTIVVEEGWLADISENGAVILHQKKKKRTEPEFENETVLLELFTNRLTSIAVEMGEMLQRTAISVNVKDRLDYSCALLSPEGDLVVNAPHIPVHLGALGLCGRRIKETLEISPGDVIITNHPGFGGSHLPDITIVTPVFLRDDELIGFTASRAHHAELGGKSPGSMPPDAKNLSEEGVVIQPSYIFRKGDERWDDVQQILQSGLYPSRNIEENLADLRAAVAANHNGAKALVELAKLYGKADVMGYMDAIKNHAAQKTRELLSRLEDGEFITEEFLDDGTRLKATINIEGDKAVFDFTGTGGVHPYNLNATPAIVNSVVMYVLRVLIDEPLPLNEGLLEPVEIILPSCLLNPDFPENAEDCPAVVGGNIEVSQRLVDTLLKPFERVACSQGTMNNVLFGNDSFGYYETVGGGTGAGPDFDGADAVHHHMTNTRGTDPELFEAYYPVQLDQYAIRKQSGGKGKHTGGDGIIREMSFIEPVSLTVLTQHRVQSPYGLKGGEAGEKGEQWILRTDGTKESVQASDSKKLNAGDRFILKTPGGGGFGISDK